MSDTHPATIVSLEKFKRDRGGDDARFLECPSCGASEFAVICRFASGAPFISTILCVKCDPPVATDVVNGMLA